MGRAEVTRRAGAEVDLLGRYSGRLDIGMFQERFECQRRLYLDIWSAHDERRSSFA
jgi:hypothetical protein